MVEWSAVNRHVPGSSPGISAIYNRGTIQGYVLIVYT